jgi:hypothetical protein
MTDSTQPFEALAFASHRNGSPIKLPRSKGEVVMLAFDHRKSRLVELHILTGEAEPEQISTPPSLIRKVKPAGCQPRRKWIVSRYDRRKSKPYGRRLVRKAPTRLDYRHRFYLPDPSLDQAEAKPEVVHDVRPVDCELLQEAAAMRGHSFMTIHETGIDDGMPFYITSLNDGEFVQDYVRRRGAVPTVTSLALVKQLLQDLGKAEEQAQPVSNIRLDRVLVISPEEEHLQLRVLDYGLCQPRPGASEQSSTRLVEEVCRLLFLLLTGQVYAGGNPDSFTVIAELPVNLRFIIKSVLTNPKNHSTSLKTLRDEVRESLCLNVSLVQARNPKMLLGADSSTLPISHLQKMLLGDIPLKTLFGASFRIENPELAGCRPFAIPATIVSTDQPVTLHLLPPERIVNQPDFMALPPQAWRYDPARQANILHMLSLWNGPDWSFVSEVREPGMTLSGLMAKRGTLNPGEVATLLRQILAGSEQALETGVHRADLDPASIHLCVGYDGPVLPRDLERLHQKRLDAWPKFMVKLRLHKTMRSLCKPRLIDLSPWEIQSSEAGDSFTARDERHRTFIGLAAYLLTGEGQVREIAEFPACVPELAAAYLLECLQSVLSGSPVPSSADFTDKLGQLLTPASTEIEGEELPIDVSQMESAGFVSDFEEDWVAADSATDRSKEELLPPVSASLRTFDFNQPLPPPKPRTSWLALAATFVIVGAIAWMILGDIPISHSEKFAAVLPSLTSASGRMPKAPEAIPQPEVVPPSQPEAQSIIHKIPAVAVAEVPAPAPAPLVAQAAPVLEPPAPPPLEKLEPQENRLIEKMRTAELPKPQIVASSSSLGSIAAEDTEPVVIRRAIPSAPQGAKPSQKVTQKASVNSSTIPMPTAGLPPANAPIPLTLEEPPTSPPASAMAAAPQSTPPAAATATEAVTVRHAIVPSAEEIKRTLRPQVSSRKKKSTRR